MITQSFEGGLARAFMKDRAPGILPRLLWALPTAYFERKQKENRTYRTREDSYIKDTGMIVGKFKLKPQGRPMRVWLKLKPTPKGDFCVFSVRAVFVNFFMHSPKRYLDGQI